MSPTDTATPDDERWFRDLLPPNKRGKGCPALRSITPERAERQRRLMLAELAARDVSRQGPCMCFGCDCDLDPLPPQTLGLHVGRMHASLYSHLLCERCTKERRVSLMGRTAALCGRVFAPMTGPLTPPG